MQTMFLLRAAAPSFPGKMLVHLQHLVKTAKSFSNDVQAL